MTLSSGTRLGPYEILAPIGAGGMGEVYRAHDPRLGRTGVMTLSIAAAMLCAAPETLRMVNRCGPCHEAPR
jgi:serine/threonine protein kinase